VGSTHKSGTKVIRQKYPRLRWWVLKGEKQDLFKDKMVEQGKYFYFYFFFEKKEGK